MRLTLLTCAAVAVSLAAVPKVEAHDAGITSVARVFIDQLSDHSYRLSVVDAGVPPFGDVATMLPSRCRPHEPAGGTTLTFDCDRPLTFDDAITLPWGLAGVVVVARWTDGSGASSYFPADGRSVPIRLADLQAASGSWLRVAQRYLVLGTEHILFGVDHLLFVLGLLLLVRSLGPLVKTVTAFTVAHSLTLGAAVLGVVSVDRGPVEAAIALSIVLLAREIVVGRRGTAHLVHRRPWLVAFVFGLLHGLGFASALGEIGLRTEDIPIALLFFNVGVEAGQLLFIAAVLMVRRAFARARHTLAPWLEPALGYALGALSTLWLFDRLPGVWGS